ncbi:MAG: multicopper oxidase family protein [Minisyncoccia bacterium]
MNTSTSFSTRKIYILITIIILIVFSFWYFSNRSNRSFSTNVPNGSVTTESQIVELKNGDTYNLTASIVKKVIAGNEVKMLAYNGSIPGPTIKVQKGAEITINFTNNTDVPTTVHSHGVRLDNKFDGVPLVTQKEVGVGESFVYKIKFPDEGIYWYHPHIREDYAQELGLYGNYIVVSDNPNYWSPVNEEVPLMVDDILVENGKIAPFSGVANHVLMGRFGNVMLTNGSDNYNMTVKQGEVIRFYVTNTSNTRVFNLGLPRAKMKLVGGDNGKYERETFVDSLLVGPSERVVVEVLFDSSGTYKLEHKTPERIYTMGTINVLTEKVVTSYKLQFLTLRKNTDTTSSIDPFRQYFDKKADKSLSFTIDMGGMGGGSHMMPDGTMMSNGGMIMVGPDDEKIEWEDNMAMMNSMSYANIVKWKIIDTDTKKENEKIDWKFKVGDKIKIKIFNDPKSMHPMQHPFHIHGQKFLVLFTNGVKNDNLVWKDTTLIQKGDTVEILVDMENPGIWMAHCHIAEHLESGMMFGFEVE